MAVHTVSPRVSVHALIREIYSNIYACTFFRKLSAPPFLVTLSLTMILLLLKQLCHQLLSLKIRVCDNSHSKLYNNVRYVVHTLYMMHSMLNYSHTNPVDTHLKKKTC